MTASHSRLHLVISGRVQGVFYRASTQREAQDRQLVGWVRNLSSGQVELVAEGSEVALRSLAAWCEIGPPSAQVSQVEADWEEATGEFRDFGVRR